jgi:hypothetical protein
MGAALRTVTVKKARLERAVSRPALGPFRLASISGLAKKRCREGHFHQTCLLRATVKSLLRKQITAGGGAGTVLAETILDFLAFRTL